MDYPKNSLFLHLLNTFPPFGPKRITKLCNFFSSPEEAFSASLSELLQCGFDQTIIEKFLAHREKLNPEQEQTLLEQNEIGLLSPADKAYPALLREIADQPPILYYKGSLLPQNALVLAVVGTRRITTYGKLVLPQILTPLLRAGLTIVSGMAFGVDAESHQLAIKAQRPTVAVLGSGLDDHALYPKDHQLLAHNILDSGGLLLSEYPIATPAYKQNFIARNRIISGMSSGTLVVECGLKSGSLITAKYALEQNRPLYAVPGPVYSPESAGPNNLLKMGAIAVTEAQDILNDLNLSEIKIPELPLPENPIESKLLSYLSKKPIQMDELIALSEFSSSQINTTLTLLELRGYIKNIGGSQYVKIR